MEEWNFQEVVIKDNAIKAMKEYASKPTVEPMTAEGKSLIDNILLDISIDVQNELLRQCKKVNCDDWQTDNINENTIAIFELNKQKYLARLYASKPTVAEREVSDEC